MIKLDEFIQRLTSEGKYSEKGPDSDSSDQMINLRPVRQYKNVSSILVRQDLHRLSRKKSLFETTKWIETLLRFIPKKPFIPVDLFEFSEHV